jgi:hypothetical protein
MVSGYHLKMYMTSAQLRLAKTGQADFWIVLIDEEERKGCVGAEGDGDVGENGEERLCDRRGWIESLASASMTRAKT